MATPFVPYRPGTVTVTNGSAAFTGSGTAFLSYDAGDALIVDGRLCRIATISSNTAGTFALPYAGTGGSGKDYDWLPSPENTRLLTQYSNVERLLIGGNLEAEAAIDGTGGDWLSYFTGAGTKARTAFTDFARTFNAAANESTALTALGLFPVQSSLTDTTANRLMLTGAFGLGDTANTFGVGSGATALADKAGTGFFVHTSGSAPGDAPVAAQGAGIKIGSGSLWQATLWAGLATVDANRWFSRVAAATGGNSSWIEFYTQASILGTVSQSSGKPTGKLIETGSNANGVYTRFADGTQICRCRQAGGSAGTWPAAFIATPYVASAVTSSVQRFIAVSARTATTYTVEAWTSGGTPSTASMDIIAVGRWF